MESADKTSLAQSLEQAVLLLAKNTWIYDFKLTRFFLDRVWESIPEEWIPVLCTVTVEQLSDIPFGGCQPHWPPSLNQFIADCLSLSLTRNLHQNANQDSSKLSCHATASAVKSTSTEPSLEHTFPLKSTDIDVEVRKGMSEKKLHEVCHMTSLVDHVTKKSGCNATVDVGSGLGYLGQVLHTKFGHSVLGLEGKQSHTAGAEKRALQDSQCSHLHNVTCELHPTADSNQELLSLIQDWFDNLLQDGSTCCHQTGSIRNAPKSLLLCTVCGRPQSACMTGSCSTCDSNSIKINQRKCDTEGKDSSTKMGNTSFYSHGFESNCSDCQKCSCLKMTETEISNTLVRNNKNLENKYVNCTEKSEGDAQTFTDSVGFSRSQNDCNVSLPDDCKASVSSSHTGMLQTDCTVNLPNNCTDSLPNDCMAGCSNVCDSLTAHDTGLEVRQTNCTVSLPNNCKTSLSNDCTTSCSNICDSLTAHCTGSALRQDTHICHCCKDSVVEEKRKEVQTHKQQKNMPPKPQPQVCMVGLHCCGDLTPTMLKCFKDLDCIRSLCCVSCCYHRMKHDESSGRFENFPMSSCVKDVMSTVPGWNPGLYGMRLAAQETRARWQGQTSADHDFHVRNVAFRGILEVCLDKGKFSLKKSSRKLAHHKDFKDFTVYIEAVSQHMHIPDSEEEDEYIRTFKEEMKSLYSEYQQFFCYIEPITALQVLLQPVIESVIYLDRKKYLLEHGYHCEIIPIFDEFISPRNLALVAVK